MNVCGADRLPKGAPGTAGATALLAKRQKPLYSGPHLRGYTAMNSCLLMKTGPAGDALLR